MQDRDIDRWRNLAAALILVGSILGMISGVLILQGNPTNLLDSSLFNNEASVDITGLVLDEDGRGLENVSIASRRHVERRVADHHHGPRWLFFV